jgi:hypothetical protein
LCWAPLTQVQDQQTSRHTCKLSCHIFKNTILNLVMIIRQNKEVKFFHIL